MIIANVSIDMTKIDKTKIKQHANRSKYYSIDIIIADTPNNYGQDVSVKQGQTKEDREAKTKPTYLGNGKVVFRKEPEGTASATSSTPPSSNEIESELPF